MYDFNKNNLITIKAQVEKKEEGCPESPHIDEKMWVGSVG